jgi:hypothetical protein
MAVLINDLHLVHVKVINFQVVQLFFFFFAYIEYSFSTFHMYINVNVHLL